MGINFGNSTGKFYTGVSDNNTASAVNISVIGVGGAGGNIIKYLSEKNLPNINLICANTDMQAMMESSARTVIQLGKNTTRGLGSGANPEVGEKSAVEASEEIKAALHGTDMLILVTGLGGGTGTGATPIISNIAREMGILTLTFAVTPFDFELERKEVCERGINNLLKSTDSLITLSNQKLLSLYNDNLNFIDAFTMVNDIIYQAIMGVVNLLLKKELINRDFSDIVQVMKNKGHSIISIGKAKGDGRAVAATTEALTNPLLSDVSIKGASGMIITICADQKSLKLSEVSDVMNAILSETKAQITKPNILFGTSFIDGLEDEIQVSIIATGLKPANYIEVASVDHQTEFSGSDLKDAADKSNEDITKDFNLNIGLSDSTTEIQNHFENKVQNIEQKSDNSFKVELSNFADITNKSTGDPFENKRGFFSEFFSKSKSFDNLGELSIKEDVKKDQINDNEMNQEFVSDSSEFDMSTSLLSDNDLNDDDFFSSVDDLEEFKENKNIESDPLFDSINEEKDDNILFLTEKQNSKKHENTYSRQVDIFELIDSITANKKN